MSDKGNYRIPLHLMIESYIYSSWTQRYDWCISYRAIAEYEVFI